VRACHARTDGRTDGRRVRAQQRRAVRSASAPDGTRRRETGSGDLGSRLWCARASTEAETTASTDLANRASLAAARDCSTCAFNDREFGGRESLYRGCEERMRCGCDFDIGGECAQCSVVFIYNCCIARYIWREIRSHESCPERLVRWA